MSKRHVRELSKVYEHLFRDAAYAFPTLRGEFERDLKTLARLAENRGIQLFVVDLPNAGKQLDRCLDNGQYKPSGLPLTRRYAVGVVIPKFLRGLYLLVFEPDGRLKEDVDIEAVFFLRQILYAAKKTTLQCDEDAVSNEVIEFASVDAELPEPSEFWQRQSAEPVDVANEFTGFSNSKHYIAKVKSLEDAEMHPKMSTFLKNLDIVSGILTSVLGRYRFEDWRFRHGPGAISETTKTVNKYCWRNWSERLESEFPIADCGFHNLASWARYVSTDAVVCDSQEPHSRLIDVPKTYTKPRLIAAEPSEHQWCQQNLWHYFCSRVRQTWISSFVRFNDQSRNQELCTLASGEGHLATVDLSAASDRVSCLAVGQFFRSNSRLLLSLRASRTRSVKQSQVASLPSVLPLSKFSTMGSAVTFPVESLMFLGIALASICTYRNLPTTLQSIKALSSEVAVFGDDIIIPKDCRELLFNALEVLDFKVNTEKSFWVGRFRESCGVDSYAGVNVTPAYWKGVPSNNPESIAMTVDVSNNFQKRFLLHTSMYIASTIRKVKMPTVGMDSGICGFKSFVRPISGSIKERWNEGLQRMESRVMRVFSRVTKTPITDDTALLQFFTEAPPAHVRWTGGVARRAKLRMKFGWVPTRDLGAQPKL